jgi:hypothetical protein
MRKNLMLPSATSNSSQTTEDRPPVLFLEVNIGGERAPGKLLLFDGDSPEEVVSCFASIY